MYVFIQPAGSLKTQSSDIDLRPSCAPCVARLLSAASVGDSAKVERRTALQNGPYRPEHGNESSGWEASRSHSAFDNAPD
jgi:hypothetical protein